MKNGGMKNEKWERLGVLRDSHFPGLNVASTFGTLRLELLHGDRKKCNYHYRTNAAN
jgi:hypothetical protein